MLVGFIRPANPVLGCKLDVCRANETGKGMHCKDIG